MKRIILMTALLFGGAQALEVRVFEPSLERVIGYGKLEGNTLTFSLVRDATGPAVVFLIDDQGDIESFKAIVEKNVVSFAPSNIPSSNVSSGSSGALLTKSSPFVSLKSFVQGKGWQFVQTLVNGNINNGNGSSGTKKK